FQPFAVAMTPKSSDCHGPVAFPESLRPVAPVDPVAPVTPVDLGGRPPHVLTDPDLVHTVHTVRAAESAGGRERVSEG
ncbi:hypothetical protein ACE14D_17565, partial [Streptomyces sp. Act-28]